MLFSVKNQTNLAKNVLRRSVYPILKSNNCRQRFYSHQDSLPKLPVPPLAQTLDKYLKTIRPLVDEESYNNTKILIEEFGKKNGEGERLQEKLELKAKSTANWLTKWWLENAYLKSRSTVVINCSPSVTFPRYNFSGIEGQIKQAAKVISAILNYKVQIDAREVPIEKLGNSPLCMDQYYNLLSTCRVPGQPMDHIAYHGHDGTPPGHISVCHNQQFFELRCFRHDGRILTLAEFETQLERIIRASETLGDPVGILTAADRDTWADSYSKLSQKPSNVASLKSIESSIFLLCLDERSNDVEDDLWRSDFALRSLHGGGSELSSGNRWFDKTIQMIVDQNGGVGLTYEHSPAEGPPVAAMLDFVYQFCENLPPQKPSSLLDLPPPRKLRFELDDDVIDAISKVSCEIDDSISKLHLSVNEFTDFGKNYLKTKQVSPDSFIQIAMQLAYFRLHQTPPATYESASLRRFLLGRTDTIRSCSIKSDQFVRAVEDGLPRDKLSHLMIEAINEHRNYVMAAIDGNGIDRHLLGLKLTALESTGCIPDIFQDSTYERAMQFNLSTSQVSCKADLCMAFGPALSQGYGICYNPKPDKLLFSVSSYDHPNYEASRFAKELSNSMRYMKDLFSKSSKL